MSGLFNRKLLSHQMERAISDGGIDMPIADATKKQIAQKRRLFLQVCLRCGARNPLDADRCRKCKSSDLRLKNRSVGLKK